MDKGANPVIVALLCVARCMIPLMIMLGVTYLLKRLYGELSPPRPDGRERGATMLLRTRDGQQVTLDGPRRTIALADGHGSTVVLGPDLLRITAATDLLIEAPGRALRVRARTVDFEEAT